MFRRYRFVPDNGTNPAVGNPPAGDPADPQPPAGTQTPEPQAGDDNTTISLEEAKKLRSEAQSLRKREKEALAKLQAYEQKEQQAADAQLPELERLKKQVSEAEGIHDGLVERLIDYEVRLQAAEMGIQPQYLKRVTQMLDFDEMEFDGDTGMPTNVETLLKALLKEMPFLTGRGQVSSGGATNPARSQTGQFSQITRDNLTEAMQQYDKLPPSQKAEVTRLLTNR